MVAKGIPHLVEPFAGYRRHLYHPVTYRAVKVGHCFKKLAVFGAVEQVGLVDDQCGLHPVSLGGGEESVDEVGGGGGMF